MAAPRGGRDPSIHGAPPHFAVAPLSTPNSARIPPPGSRDDGAAGGAMAAVAEGLLGQVDARHRRLSGLRIEGGAQLVGDLAHQALPIGLRHGAVLLATLQVEVEAVDPQSVGSRLAPPPA